jgi:hypothetical protein
MASARASATPRSARRRRRLHDAHAGRRRPRLLPAGPAGAVPGRYVWEMREPWDRFLALGTHRHDPRFCMTALAIRLSSIRNGVSRLHGVVSRACGASVWPELLEHDVPIGHITNGVHLPTWVGPDVAELYATASDRTGRTTPTSCTGTAPPTSRRTTCGGAAAQRAPWSSTCASALAAEARRRGEECSSGRGRPRSRGAHHRLRPPVRHVQARHAAALAAGAAGPAAARHGPARAVHLRRQGAPEGRARARRCSADRRSSRGGRSSGTGSSSSRATTSELARHLVQGADVWLNVPLRPYEASGTSGMKAAANGGLNLSIPDGWWAEAWEEHNRLPEPIGWSRRGGRAGRTASTWTAPKPAAGTATGRMPTRSSTSSRRGRAALPRPPNGLPGAGPSGCGRRSGSAAASSTRTAWCGSTSNRVPAGSGGGRRPSGVPPDTGRRAHTRGRLTARDRPRAARARPPHPPRSTFSPPRASHLTGGVRPREDAAIEFEPGADRDDVEGEVRAGAVLVVAALVLLAVRLPPRAAQDTVRVLTLDEVVRWPSSGIRRRSPRRPPSRTPAPTPCRPRGRGCPSSTWFRPTTTPATSASTRPRAGSSPRATRRSSRAARHLHRRPPLLGQRSARAQFAAADAQYASQQYATILRRRRCSTRRRRGGHRGRRGAASAAGAGSAHGRGDAAGAGHGDAVRRAACGARDGQRRSGAAGCGGVDAVYDAGAGTAGRHTGRSGRRRKRCRTARRPAAAGGAGGAGDEDVARGDRGTCTLRLRRAERLAAFTPYLPTVRLTGGYDWFAIDFPPEQRSWSLRLAASLPVFNGFQREAAVQRASAAERVAEARARDAELAARVPWSRRHRTSSWPAVASPLPTVRWSWPARTCASRRSGTRWVWRRFSTCRRRR